MIEWIDVALVVVLAMVIYPWYRKWAHDEEAMFWRLFLGLFLYLLGLIAFTLGWVLFLEIIIVSNEEGFLPDGTSWTQVVNIFRIDLAISLCLAVIGPFMTYVGVRLRDREPHAPSPA